MIGKVINYNDNTDAFGIMGIDNKVYYGFEYYNKSNLTIGDIITFSYKTIGNESRIAMNIKPYSAKAFTLKLTQTK